MSDSAQKLVPADCREKGSRLHKQQRHFRGSFATFIENFSPMVERIIENENEEYDHIFADGTSSFSLLTEHALNSFWEFRPPKYGHREFRSAFEKRDVHPFIDSAGQEWFKTMFPDEEPQT